MTRRKDDFERYTVRDLFDDDPALQSQFPKVILDLTVKRFLDLQLELEGPEATSEMFKDQFVRVLEDIMSGELTGTNPECVQDVLNAVTEFNPEVAERFRRFRSLN